MTGYTRDQTETIDSRLQVKKAKPGSSSIINITTSF